MNTTTINLRYLVVPTTKKTNLYRGLKNKGAVRKRKIYLAEPLDNGALHFYGPEAFGTNGDIPKELQPVEVLLVSDRQAFFNDWMIDPKGRVTRAAETQKHQPGQYQRVGWSNCPTDGMSVIPHQVLRKLAETGWSEGYQPALSEKDNHRIDGPWE